MSALRPTEFHTISDLQQQVRLERMLAARRAAEAAREARYRQLPTPAQPEPVNFCAEPEDSDPPLKWMLLWAALAIPGWALFGWGVVALVRWLV